MVSCGWLWLLFVLQNCTTLARELDFPKKQAPLSCESSRSRANAVNYQSLFENRTFRARGVEKTNSGALIGFWAGCLWLAVVGCGCCLYCKTAPLSPESSISPRNEHHSCARAPGPAQCCTFSKPELSCEKSRKNKQCQTHEIGVWPPEVGNLIGG